MALIYKGYQTSIANKEGKKLYYPRLVKTGEMVSTQQLGELIAEKSSLTAGDVHNVIRNLMSVMREQLLNSKSVKLDGFGSFTMIAKAGGNGVDNMDDVNSTQIKRLTCRFTPEASNASGAGLTRALVQGATYIRLDKFSGAPAAASDDAGSGSGNGSGSGGGLEE